MLHTLIHFISSIDQQLITFVSAYGAWAYGLLFLIIFCETGLIVTPFLPGDSLLFIAGGLSTQAGSLNIGYLFIVLVMASWLGNQVNYQVGNWIGSRVFAIKNSWLFKPQYLQHTHDFYLKHGKATIILARFMPIIRTFAPFVAGVAKMNLRVFTCFNLLSAVIWVGSLLLAGYLLGQVPLIQNHLNVMIYIIVFVSLLPGIITVLREQGKRKLK
jgi:membrane-associated protein